MKSKPTPHQEPKIVKYPPLNYLGNTYETSKSRFMAVKTNALAWGMTIMNIEGEVEICSHLSTSLPVWWCPWFIGNDRALRVLATQPSLRWWPQTIGKGHFFGPHFSIATYNLRWGDIRYQDNGRPLLGAGITYGYAFHINDYWGIELSIGAGYTNTRYDRFHNITNGGRIDTRQTSYWGIDHASVSFTYHFQL